jgi:hypothetical protein
MGKTNMNAELKDFFTEETKPHHKELKKEELRLVKDKVENIMQESFKARNSDKSLISIYLKEFHNIELTEEELREIPSFESITRVGRKLREEGLYPATEKTDINRAVFEGEVREWVRE